MLIDIMLEINFLFFRNRKINNILLTKQVLWYYHIKCVKRMTSKGNFINNH